jgi:hypothetical protein
MNDRSGCNDCAHDPAPRILHLKIFLEQNKIQNSVSEISNLSLSSYYIALAPIHPTDSNVQQSESAGMRQRRVSIELTLIYVNLSIRRFYYYTTIKGSIKKLLTILAEARVCQAPIDTAIFCTLGGASSLVNMRVSGTLWHSFSHDVVVAHGDGDGSIRSGSILNNNVL